MVTSKKTLTDTSTKGSVKNGTSNFILNFNPKINNDSTERSRLRCINNKMVSRCRYCNIVITNPPRYWKYGLSDIHQPSYFTRKKTAIISFWYHIISYFSSNIALKRRNLNVNHPSKQILWKIWERILQLQIF